MALRCAVFRALVKGAAEESNKHLSTQRVRMLHMAPDESGDPASVTLIVDDPDPSAEVGL